MSTTRTLLEAIASADGARSPLEDRAVSSMEVFCGPLVTASRGSLSGSLRDLIDSLDSAALEGRLPIAMWFVCAADVDERPFTTGECAFIGLVRERLGAYAPSELLPRLAYLGRWASDTVRDAAAVLALPICADTATMNDRMESLSATLSGFSDDAGDARSANERTRRLGRIAEAKRVLHQFIVDFGSLPLMVWSSTRGGVEPVQAVAECRCPLCGHLQSLRGEGGVVWSARCIVCRALLAHDRALLEDILRLRKGITGIDELQLCRASVIPPSALLFDAVREIHHLRARLRSLESPAPLRLPEAMPREGGVRVMVAQSLRGRCPTVWGSLGRLSLMLVGGSLCLCGFIWFPAWSSVVALTLGVALLALPPQLRLEDSGGAWGRMEGRAEEWAHAFRNRSAYLRVLAEHARENSLRRCRQIGRSRDILLSDLECADHRIAGIWRAAHEPRDARAVPDSYNHMRERLSRFRIEDSGVSPDVLDILRGLNVRSAADIDLGSLPLLGLESHVARHLLLWRDSHAMALWRAASDSSTEARVHRGVDTEIQVVAARVGRVVKEVESYRTSLGEAQRHVLRLSRRAARYELMADRICPGSDIKASRFDEESWRLMDDVARIMAWIRVHVRQLGIRKPSRSDRGPGD